MLFEIWGDDFLLVSLMNFYLLFYFCILNLL